MPRSAELTSVNDLDDLNQQAGWQAEYRQLRPGQFQAGFCFGSSSGFDLTKEVLTGDLEVLAIDQDDAVSLLIRRQSSGQLRFNGCVMESGDPFLLMPGAELKAHTRSSIIVDTIPIPLSRIAEIAEALAQPRQGFLPGASRKLNPDRSVVSGFTRALDDALLGDTADPADSEPGLNQAVECFVASLLSVEEANRVPRRRSRSGGFRNFQMALEFIDANLSEQISVADVCRQTGVLPLAYIKAKRLNAARRALIVADPREDTVTQIAAEHGITHLGRFSRDYQYFFGERPSKTLMSPS